MSNEMKPDLITEFNKRIRVVPYNPESSYQDNSSVANGYEEYALVYKNLIEEGQEEEANELVDDIQTDIQERAFLMDEAMGGIMSIGGHGTREIRVRRLEDKWLDRKNDE